MLNKAKIIANNLKSLKNVKGISLYGSVGSGYIDKYSDIDIIAFCNKLPDIKKRKKILDKFTNDIMMNGGEWSQFRINGIEAVIHYKKISDVKRILRIFFSKKSVGYQKDINTLIYSTKIVYDPGGLLKKWKKRVEKYPQWLKKRVINQIRFAGGIFEEVFKSLVRNNKVWLDYSINYRIDYGIIQVLYALNEKYFSISKWFYKDIKKFKKLPKNCLKRIKKIYSLNNSGQLVRKMKLINDLIFDIYELCKKETPSLRKPTRTKEECNKIIKKIEKIVKK